MTVHGFVFSVPALALGLACSTTQPSRSASTQPEQPQAGATASAGTEGATMGADAGSSAAPSVPSGAERELKGHPSAQVISGRVAIASGSSLVIDTDDGAERTLSVVEETTVRVNGEEASLAELVPGDNVRASYDEEDGRQVAVKVEASQGALGGSGSNAPVSPASRWGSSGPAAIHAPAEHPGEEQGSSTGAKG